ncbi:membrane dipeptidase [Anaerolineae bacterium]|nr:membrane dipeptidase [Anaerolineae bacterium]
MNIVDLHAHPLLDRLYAAYDLRGRHPVALDPFGNRLGFDALQQGQVGAIVSAIYPFWCPQRRSAYMDRCRDILTLIETCLTEHADSATVVTDSAGIECALARGKVAVIHAVEGGHVLEGRLENLEKLCQWRVRSLTLTHFLNNDLAASSFDPRRKLAGRNGLTPFGREVVAGMNTLGMVIDLAHSSERAFWQVMELTKYPVVVSHTGVRRFVPWEICLSDEQLKALAQNDGLVGIILSSIWLKRLGLADIGDLVDNILYVCDLVGVDHVGLGSDFNGTPPLRGVRTASDFPRIAECLAGRGLSDYEVAKIMGGNFLRVFKQVVNGQ